MPCPTSSPFPLARLVGTGEFCFSRRCSQLWEERDIGPIHPCPPSAHPGAPQHLLPPRLILLPSSRALPASSPVSSRAPACSGPLIQATQKTFVLQRPSKCLFYFTSFHSCSTTSHWLPCERTSVRDAALLSRAVLAHCGLSNF